MPSYLVTEEKKQEQLILLVDKQNRFGSLLAQHLLTQATVVLVSEKENTNPSVIHVPFEQDSAHIPDGSYSHIIFIWDHEKESLDLLKSLVDKARDTSARFLFVCDYHAYSESILEKIQRDGVASSCVLTGDIYDEKTSQQMIYALFHQAKEESRITLSHMGLEPVHIVTLAQTINAILRVSLGTTRAKLTFAFSPHPLTLLAIAHALQQIEPLLQIDLSENDGVQTIKALPKGDYLLHEVLSLKEIQQAFKLYLQQGQTEKKVMKEEIKTTVPAFLTEDKPTFGQARTRKKKSKKWLGFIFLILLILLPFIIPVGCAWGGVLLLQQIKTSSMQGQFFSGVEKARSAKDLFLVAEKSDSLLLWGLQTVNKKDLAQTFAVNVGNGLYVADGATHMLTAFDDYQKVVTGSAPFPQITFSQGINELQLGILSLQQVNTTSPYVLEKTNLQQVTKYTHVLANTVSIFPQLFGMQKKQTYLILFQNNMELRPSGGFIGSYGLITVDKGKLGQLVVHDVYDADGQLKGHIEPPFAIRRYIPLVHWYLRDSGFDIDFSKAAAQAAYFLKQETGQQVDGVVALDLSFVQQIIQAVGEISVPEYNQTVTAQNFFLLTESHAEKNFFAGSTQKKDFLQALFTHLQQALVDKHVSIPSLVQAGENALQQKHLLLTMADPSLQAVFTVNGFSSTLWDNRVAAPNTLLDFTGINEANIGVNKVNYFVKRSVEQQVTIHATGTVSAELTISFTNTSDGNWPGGDYKNYLRFILPQDAVLRSVAIDGVDERLQAAVTNPSLYEASSFKPPLGLEVERAQEEGRVVYGFLMSVVHGQAREVHITYDLQQAFAMNKQTATYSQLFYKQPGMLAYPYTFSLMYPANMSLVSTPGGFQKGATSLTRKFSFDEDTTMTFPFVLQ